MMKRDFGNRLQKILQMAQLGFLLFAILLLILWAITPTRSWLESFQIFDYNSMLAVVAIALILTISLLSQLHKSFTTLSTRIEQFTKASSAKLIPNGILDVYPNLFKALDSIKNKEQKTLKVLGLTLYTAWPKIEAWLKLDKTRDWDITLFCLSPEFAGSSPNQIPQKWVQESKTYSEEISNYIKERAEDLNKKSINLKLILYSHFPAVHGFLLGNDALFISFSHWDCQNNCLEEPRHFYEFFEPSDKSQRAELYRALFKNWICKAERGGELQN